MAEDQFELYVAQWGIPWGVVLVTNVFNLLRTARGADTMSLLEASAGLGQAPGRVTLPSHSGRQILLRWFNQLCSLADAPGQARFLYKRAGLAAAPHPLPEVAAVEQRLRVLLASPRHQTIFDPGCHVDRSASVLLALQGSTKQKGCELVLHAAEPGTDAAVWRLPLERAMEWVEPRPGEAAEACACWIECELL